jgi:hypothetical protein
MCSEGGCVELTRTCGEGFRDGQRAQKFAPSVRWSAPICFLSYGGYGWLVGGHPPGGIAA